MEVNVVVVVILFLVRWSEAQAGIIGYHQPGKIKPITHWPSHPVAGGDEPIGPITRYVSVAI